jgi:trehalose 6-phosphate phosphatase
MMTLIEPGTVGNAADLPAQRLPAQELPAQDLLAAQQAIALFLDFDGTLVEIAPAPDEVRLDRRVPAALDVLRQTLGGALALVSGRPVSFLDAVLDPYRFDTAALHGAQIRIDGAIRSQAEVPGEMREALRDLVRFANSHVGIIVEDKRISAALHWRLAPQLHDEALDLMRAVARRMGPAVRLQEGKSVAEIVPAQASKGTAIAQLMQMAPYAGRLPVFIGDDITDEHGFEAVNALGGLSIRIGGGDTQARLRIASPTSLRTILLDAAERGSLTASSFSQG